MKKSVKILISFLALFLLFGCTISAADVLPGDLNGDGKTNSADAIYLLRHTILPESYLINQSGDMNGDGETNSVDAVYLLRHTILPEDYPLKPAPDCEHRIVTDAAVAPTCSAPGLTEGKHCEICMTVFVRQEIIDPLPHNFKKAVCTVCGAKAEISEGLAYTLSPDGAYYIVTGIGECLDRCVVIPETYRGLPVKAIGDNAFAEHYQLSEVVLPDGLAQIGRNAFSITGLSYISIPESVTQIREGAFYACPSLTEITLPSGLSELCDELFLNCFQLRSVNIPKNVTKLGARVFSYCYDLETIALHDDITEIGEGAFAYCTSLKNIEIPKNLYAISKETFMNCYALESVRFPENLMQIGEAAFDGCSSLTSVAVPDLIKVIQPNTFANCISLVNVRLPQSLKSIERGAFVRTALAEIVIPDSVTSIGQGAFHESKYLRSVRLPDTLEQIAIGTFKGCCALESIAIPDGVGVIREEAFKGCTALKTVELPGSLKSVEAFAFADCSALEEIIFDGSEGEWVLIFKSSGWNEGIGAYTLVCLKQPEMTDDLIYSLHTDGMYYSVKGIRDSEKTDIIIPSTHEGLPVLKIDDGAFENCHHLVSVTIEEGVESIGARAFYQCNRLYSVDLANTIRTVGEQAFGNCYALRFVNMPDALETISDGLFEYCRDLRHIVLPIMLKHIGRDAFRGCTSLTPELPDGLVSIGEQAFYDCAFETIVFPESLQFIGEGAFYNCYQLKEAVLPGDLMVLPKNVFAQCTSLYSVVLPQNLVEMCEGAFRGCTGISFITIPESVKSIEAGVFQYVFNLSISYEGTKYAWMMIEKAEDWDRGLTYTLTFMETDDTTVKDIYSPDSYAGTYAYRYLGTLNKGEALQKYYDMMDTLCYHFHIGNDDVQPMTNSNGQYGILGILDFRSLGLTSDEANGVWVAYILDHPLYYWIENAIALSDTSLYFLVDSDYFLARERSVLNQTIYAKIQEWTALVSEERSPYQIALAYHDLIVSEIDYAYESDVVTPQEDSWAHSIIGVLGGKGEAVCEGYAKTFHLLLNYSNVENIYVNGYADGGHSWNMVRLDDGNWYWCDLTWDDNPAWAWGIDYHYFCVNSTQNINWYYQDGGYIIDVDGDGILDVETFADSHTPDSVSSGGMKFAYPLPAISQQVFDGALRDTFVVNNMTYAISGYRTVQFVSSTKNGNVTIPETVLYNGVTYTVTSIGGILDNGIYAPYPTVYSANTVYVPKTVKYIWDGAFDGNQINVTVDAENPYYYSENGKVYPKMAKTFYLGAKNVCRPEKIRKSVS